MLIRKDTDEDVEFAIEAGSSDEPGYVIIHRDQPGDHAGSDCWCGPQILRADDDETWAKLTNPSIEAQG